MTHPRVERSFTEPYIRYTCRCTWQGNDDDIEEWVVQHKHDRTVRCCPSCGEPVPEWGTIHPIDGAAQIARGPLKDALTDAGVLNE